MNKAPKNDSNISAKILTQFWFSEYSSLIFVYMEGKDFEMADRFRWRRGLSKRRKEEKS